MTDLAPSGERFKSEKDVRLGIHFPAMAWPYQGMGANLKHAVGAAGTRSIEEGHEATFG